MSEAEKEGRKEGWKGRREEKRKTVSLILPAIISE